MGSKPLNYKYMAAHILEYAYSGVLPELPESIERAVDTAAMQMYRYVSNEAYGTFRHTHWRA